MVVEVPVLGVLSTRDELDKARNEGNSARDATALNPIQDFCSTFTQ